MEQAGQGTLIGNKTLSKTVIISRFVCCNVDGCNWSLDNSISNSSPFTEEEENILVTALPFIIAAIILMALISICCALCCGGSCCTSCGCLCCGAAGKAKRKKKNIQGYENSEPSININNRVRTIEKAERTLTPVGIQAEEISEKVDERKESESTLEDSTNRINVQAATVPVEDLKEVVALKASDIDGVKNPKSVDEDAITKTALYHFQPRFS